MILVPKVFHRIWLGPKPMPEEYRRYGETWLDHHPGWSMKLWTEEDLADSLFPELVPECPTYATMASIYRYEIIHRVGGVYIDTDFECLRSIEPLIDGHACFGAYQRDDIDAVGAIANGFFGAVPEHPLFEMLLKTLPRAFVCGDRFCVGPHFFTAKVRYVGAFHDIRIFDRPLFYPYLWTELERRDESFPDAYAVHHWGQASRGVPWCPGFEPEEDYE